MNYANFLPREVDFALPISTDFTVPVKRFDPAATVPKFGTPGAAAVDLSALEGGFIPRGHSKIVDVGLGFAIPEGYVGLICSRSGLAAKAGVFVMNAPGVIDSDYRGVVKLIIQNAGQAIFYFGEGDRLAQMMFIKHETPVFVEVDELSATERGEGGFGSTGVARVPA